MQMSELGLIELDYCEFAVENLSSWSALLERNMGFPVVKYSEKSGKKSTLHVSGNVRILLSESSDKDSDVSRFLQIHREGVMTIALRVSEIDRAYQVLSLARRRASIECREQAHLGAVERAGPSSVRERAGTSPAAGCESRTRGQAGSWPY